MMIKCFPFYPALEAVNRHNDWVLSIQESQSILNRKGFYFYNNWIIHIYPCVELMEDTLYCTDSNITKLFCFIYSLCLSSLNQDVSSMFLSSEGRCIFCLKCHIYVCFTKQALCCCIYKYILLIVQKKVSTPILRGHILVCVISQCATAITSML